jgi:hypothetical protein
MEFPKESPRKPRRPFRRLSLKTAIAVLVGLTAIAAIAGYLALSDGDSDKARRAASAPTQGIACPYLRQAYEASLQRDERTLRTSVETAAKAGESALDTSGQIFGRPEEVAIELEYAISMNDDAFAVATTLFDDARTACNRIGKW